MSLSLFFSLLVILTVRTGFNGYAHRRINPVVGGPSLWPHKLLFSILAIENTLLKFLFFIVAALVSYCLEWWYIVPMILLFFSGALICGLVFDNLFSMSQVSHKWIYIKLAVVILDLYVMKRFYDIIINNI